MGLVPTCYNPRMPSLQPMTAERLLAHCSYDGDCWIWTGFNDGRYGKAKDGGTTRLVHRVAYELWLGPIPEGKILHHTCRRKLCFNPEHLEPVDQVFHLMVFHGAKRCCFRGHPFDQENTRIERRFYKGKWREVQRCRKCIAYTARKRRQIVRDSLLERLGTNG